MALRLFFSLLLCLDLPLASPSCPEDENVINTCQSTGIVIVPHTREPNSQQIPCEGIQGKQENSWHNICLPSLLGHQQMRLPN